MKPQAAGARDPAAAPPPRLLFQRQDGSAVRFYVRPGAAKAELAPLVHGQGGRLCRVQEPGAVLLAQPGEVLAGARGDFIWTRYIADCVASDERLPLERYRLPPRTGASASGVGKSSSGGRMPFTAAEDRAILLYLRSTRRGRAAATGTALWKDMARAQVTLHSWQAMRDRYLKQLQGRERNGLLAQNPSGGALEPGLTDRAGASQSKQAVDVSQQEDERHTTKESKAPSIFQMANQEFEGGEWENESTSLLGNILPNCTEPRTSEESVNPEVRVVGSMLSEASAVPQSPSLGEDQPSRPSPEQVARAVEDMKRFMEEFGVDLETVTQAFLKTSGEVAAVAHCLQKDSHSDGCPPLWNKQDDTDLLSGDDCLRSKLTAKYGVERVTRRLAFRKS